MSRNEQKEYWGADLPKGSDALSELDKFCNDQGMISRSDATRMILIAWAKLRQGKDASVWPGQPAQPQQSAAMPQTTPTPLQGIERPRRAMLNGNAAAVELD